jgi:hypothetical protein
MNKPRLIVLWLIGLSISAIICSTGLKLLAHTAKYAETMATGYPFTLLAGTAWAYVAPIIIIGVMLLITFKDHRKKK